MSATTNVVKVLYLDDARITKLAYKGGEVTLFLRSVSLSLPLWGDLFSVI